MHPTSNLRSFVRRRLVLPCALLTVVPAALAQSAPSPAELAQYDTNKNGVLDPNERAAMEAAQKKAAQAVTTTDGAATNSDGSVVRMSPFSVTTDSSGYYAQNTVFGSRLNTNLGDLASSITVVTKQQLEDTGSIDINDVFMYEANTEGANTYTPMLLNRGTARDGIAGYSNDDGIPFGVATANRVRGLGSADTSQNNYPTISRILPDNYNVNSVEISRGPNSLLFGTGAASGIVNQSTAEAVLNQNHTTVTARYGSYDAWRASLATNVPLGNKVAIYGAMLYDERGFPRKPSADIYRRQTIAMTYRPFSKTKITGSFENYDNYNNRPNFAMPTDYVTPWVAAGRPSFDPTTQMVTLSNGKSFGPYLIDSRDPRFVSAAVSPVGDAALSNSTSAFFVPGITFPGRQRIRYDDGRIVDAWVDNALSGAGATTAPLNLYAAPAVTARTAAQWLAASARYTTTAAPIAPIPPASTGATQWGNWYEVGVTDKSVYDWTKYNIQGANYGTQQARTFNIEFQQEVLSNLNVQLGWFRQELKEHDHYGLGQVNDSLRLFVDTNTKLLDGTPNPYYGAPYVQDWQADDFSRPEKRNNFRAMVAYELDLRKNNNWTRYLGRQRFLGLGSRDDDWINNLRYRLSFDGGDARFLPVGATTGAAFNWSGSPTIARYYYLSHGNTSGNITEGIVAPGAPQYGGADSTAFRFYNWNTQSYANTVMNFDNNALYAGNGNGVTTRRVDSESFAWQGYLWSDRLIPTFGWRNDKLKIRQNSRTGLSTATLYPGGFGTDQYSGVLGTPFYIQGSTKTLGGVVKPFSGWARIDHAAESGSFLAQLARGSSFHYNQSDNFNAPPAVQYDFFGVPLGKPQGHGKDYGFGISLFNNKLVARLNWYESTDENAPAPIASTVTGRTVRIDNSSGLDWARKVVRVRHGQSPSDPNFDNNTVFPLTDQMASEIQAVWGLPFTLNDRWPTFGGPQGTSTNISKGKELQLTYNPTRAWTMKLTVGQQFATYQKALRELTDWIAFRKPQWMAMAAPDLQTVYTLSNGNKMYLGNYWNGYGFSGDAASDANGPRGSPAATYASIVEPGLYQLTAQEGAKQPNLREWSWNYITSYNFQQGRLRGLGVGGGIRWQDKAVAGYYGETNPARYAHPSPGQSAIVYPDLARPIYLPAEAHIDLWLSYSRRVFSDKAKMKIQLNVRDAGESGGLQAILFNPDGSPAQYRIIDPRTWFLTTTFDF
ncbi:MAG TPA: TonB-dependent receptor plug domain-containing protein [Opitutaceae bacterium]|nr:TonB-dependent receptor plug domain-containing protein [Opitutaceae bacterium]